MQKIKNDRAWLKCGLCGKKINEGEMCWQISFKKKLSWHRYGYRREHWHLRHFVFRDYSATCDRKMECITGNDPSINLDCHKKLCDHYK